MADKNSDYKKINFNLNNFLPEANKGEFLESLNKNLFNRYLTKDEFDHIVGIIGEADPNDTTSKPIVERTPFRQANQLQPVVTEKIGSVNHFMAFEDFMTRIGRTGVDTDKFDEWGDTLQFNWVPPIDIDKIVNYRDYYWNTLANPDHSIPQYIVIKSQKNWAQARFSQALKTIIEFNGISLASGVDEVNQLIFFAGNDTAKYPVGNRLILSQSDGTMSVVTIATSTYNVAATRTEIETVEAFAVSPLGIDVNVTAVEIPVVTTSGTTATISGDYTNLLINGYVVGVSVPPTRILGVSKSEFSAVPNTTVVTFTETVPVGVTQLSLYPVLSMIQAEAEVAADSEVSFPTGVWSDSDIGKLFWYTNTELTTGTMGSTTLGLQQLQDVTQLFPSYGIVADDILQIMPENKGAGKYTIASVAGDIININSGEMFTASNLDYRVLRTFGIAEISNTTAPISPDVNQLWLNTITDTLSQWDGSTWNIVYIGVSKLNDLVRERQVTNYTNDNDWSNDNEWVHTSQISEFTGMVRAQMPIIEYFPFIEMSETSYSEKVWRYRRSNLVSYIDATTAPKMIELMDFTYSGTQFTFPSLTQMRFNQQFGNFVSELKAGDQVRLTGFDQNNGIYTIASVDYSSPGAGQRWVSTITFNAPVASVSDLPAGATIEPVLTSLGDPFTGLATAQWQFGGVKEIRASSTLPEPNPMLGINVSTQINAGFESIVGLTSQTYSLQATAVQEPILWFDISLQDLVLYDDYQEGDIRVYINGERVYGVFEDLASSSNPDYVGGIRFINGYIVLGSDIIRVELGEYAKNEIGLRAITVNTAIGPELYNLTNTRRIEQRKSESQQYPFFALRDIYSNRLNLATSIFKYAESETSPVNVNVLKRIVTNSDGTDYSFVQELKNPDTGRLYCYYDYQEVGDELQTIWKRGTNNERYEPIKIDGEWELPNQWYYNISHENYTQVKLTEIFRHFKSIIDLQDQPGLFSKTAGLFFLDDNVNYGVGGTIKEHNDGFDTLVSSVFVNNGTPAAVINFAKSQYDNQVRYVKERFHQDVSFLFNGDSSVTDTTTLQTFITDSIINFVENNGKYDVWFGDTTSYDTATTMGVRNWIATLPQFGLQPRFVPFIAKDSDLGIYNVHCHDGHVISVGFPPALTEQLLRRITAGAPHILQTVTSDADPFPTTYDGNPLFNGIYLIRTNTVSKTRKLYRSTEAAVWEFVDVNEMFANSILEIENRLYAVLSDSADVANFESIYDFTTVENDPSFDSLMELQFQEYTRLEGISTPLSNTDRFRQNNPFTWNYYHSPIQNDPITGGISYNTAGTWQALYSNVFGTQYPHLEPWSLQGYANKPSWWDAQYKDTTGTRRWTPAMWANIFDGIVPAGLSTPNGGTGTGSTGQITPTFDYLPVNTGTTPTDDGYLPDDLLPPFWNTVNTSDAKIRGLYDPNAGEFVTTPQLDFEFGQDGLVEWEWKQSVAYLYDKLIVAYKIDPMRFLHQTFGVDYQLVSCLQVSKETEKVFSHSDVIFHGDFLDDQNAIYKAFGTNQWYVHYQRYSGFDGISSEFRSLWKDWDTDLSYLVGAFLDTPSFSIENNFFDITTKDFQINVKKTPGIDDKWLTSLTATVLSVPSEYARQRDKGIGWTVEISNNSPLPRPITYHPVQNYSVNLNTGSATFRTFSYPLTGADITPARGFQVVEYNSPVAMSSSTGLNSATTYPISVTFDGATTVTFAVDGSDAQTFEDLFEVINAEFGASGSITIENGNVVVYSSSTSPSSSVSITDNTLFLNTNGFVQLSASQSTPNTFDKVLRISGNFFSTFVTAGQVVVTNSANFNGTFTISKVYYDATTAHTLIFVEEDVVLPPTGTIVVDGIVEPANAKTLPPEWITGTEVFFNTTGYLPNNLSDTTPYYVIRVSDREFKVAESQDAALKGVAIYPSSPAIGEVFIGKVMMTFTALGGNVTDYVWRQHFADYRYVVESNSNLIISGVQQMVDFLNGYDSYTQTDGFRYRNVNGENYDLATGLNNNWQTVTEKFISWMYALRNFRQQQTQTYRVSANVSTDTFVMASGAMPNWANGTPIVLVAEPNGTLPPEFDNPISSVIPYYVIRVVGSTTEFKLAATAYDAAKGNAIELTGSGTGYIRVQVYQPMTQFPTYELNPFKNYVWIRHEQGVLSNVLDEDYTDPTSAARLYDNHQLELTVQDVLVFREDKESRISLTEDLIASNRRAEATLNTDTTHMSGMHLFFDGYEHIIKFNDYAVDGSLIYDSFLGLNTPRFYVEFDRQQELTLRPNVGGFYLHGESLKQNFESTVNDMRRYYDSVTAPEGRITTDLVRKSLGYDGPKDYFSDLKINPKTQFQFWQAMIQSKGANRAVTAFTNQEMFDDAIVDEFWAYKVAEFGDNKEQNYIEMKLRPTDVVKNDLRIEFIAPENTPVDDTFDGVELTDMSRWWNQPDQIQAMHPYESFFFNAKVASIIDNVQSKVKLVGGLTILEFDHIVDSVVMTYVDALTGETKTLNEINEYEFLNSHIVSFLVDIFALPEITISTLSYDYDSQNPAKIIDKDAGSVIATVPLWNPAIGQYYNTPYHAVDLRRPTDPALYSETLDGANTGTAAWKANHLDTVWMDSSIEQYLPYYDKTVMPNINDRIEQWGTLADWADINLYQWTQTTIAPEDYDALAVRQSFDLTIPDAQKVTGSVYKLLYQDLAYVPNGDNSNPQWEKIEDTHYDFVAGLVTDTGMDVALVNQTVNVFINGKTFETVTFTNLASVVVYFAQFPFATYVHIVIPAHVPTQQELDNRQYVYHTPRTVEQKFDSTSGDIYNVYYYWVKEKKQSVSELYPGISLFSAKRDLVDMTAPYMILQGVRTPDFGYGLIFGHVFDEIGYNLPYRYTQLIGKGLHGTVKDINRYVMRFTRDFTLRDHLRPTDISLKNKHTEWKLFREKQLEKIDRYLWIKVIEALVGFKLTADGTAMTTIAVPSLNRVLFDRLYQADTQYGLGDEQVFTNKELSLQTIIAVLSDPNQNFEYVDIDDFMSRHDFLTPEDIIAAMTEIYFNFSTEEVNMLFFAVLHDAMSLKLEHKEIFKTSWVALQISQNVKPSIPMPYDELRLVPGPDCDVTPPPPSPTPSPTPTPLPPSPTPTPSPTPLPLCGNGELDRALEDDEVRTIETDDCREIEHDLIFCGGEEIDRIMEDTDGEARITEDTECRIVEPSVDALMWAIFGEGTSLPDDPTWVEGMPSWFVWEQPFDISPEESFEIYYTTYHSDGSGYYLQDIYSGVEYAYIRPTDGGEITRVRVLPAVDGQIYLDYINPGEDVFFQNAGTLEPQSFTFNSVEWTGVINYDDDVGQWVVDVLSGDFPALNESKTNGMVFQDDLETRIRYVVYGSV